MPYHSIGSKWIWPLALSQGQTYIGWYTIAESFYYVNYGSSIITSKVSLSNNLSNENINTGVSVVFKTEHELKCQNELFLKYHFSGHTSLYVFLTEIIWRTFDVIFDNP